MNIPTPNPDTDVVNTGCSDATPDRATATDSIPAEGLLPTPNSAPSSQTQSVSPPQLSASSATNRKARRRRSKKAELPCTWRIPRAEAEKLRGPGFDLDRYLSYFPEVTPAGRSFLRTALEKGPSREFNGTANVTLYASTEFGRTIPTESHAELPVALVADDSEEVLLVLTQLPKVALCYKSGNSIATPSTRLDFVLLTVNGPIIGESKLASKFAALCAEQPARYKQDDSGRFYSPPLDEVARELGFPPAKLTSEKNFSRAFLCNKQFLSFYERRNLVKPISQEEEQHIYTAIHGSVGLRANDVPLLPYWDPARRSDVILSMIVAGKIAANVTEASVLDFSQLRIFKTKLLRTAFTIFNEALEQISRDGAVPIAELFPVGARFKLGRNRYTVESLLPNAIKVIDEVSGRSGELTHVLLRDADVTPITTEAQMSATRLIVSLGEERLYKTIRNFRKISRFLHRGPDFGCTPSDRHVRRLLRRWRLGGIRGLIPNTHNRGNREPRKSAESTACLEEVIKSRQNGENPNATVIHGAYLKLAEKRGIPESDQYSKRSVQRVIEAQELYTRVRLSEGRRNALKHRRPRGKRSILGRANGRFPWAVGHIDHTLGDDLVFNPATGKFERPYISALVDGYDGRILAAVVWFGHPNAKIVVEVLKDCLNRHGVVPIKIRCDWGSEFRSTFVQTALAGIGIHVSYRPKGEPRSGSPVETSFKKMNVKCLHTLPGNTQATKNPRGLTDATDPRNFACISEANFHSIMNDYISTHNGAPRTLKASPNDMYADFVAQHGTHCAQWLSPELFDRLDFEPLRHSTRIVSRNGTVRVNYEDYTAPEFAALIGEEVRVFAKAGDARFIRAEHPKTRQQFVCNAASSDVVDTDSAAEACAVVEKRGNSYERIKQADRDWADFQERARELAQQGPLAGVPERPAPPASPKASNVSATGLKVATLITD